MFMSIRLRSVLCSRESVPVKPTNAHLCWLCVLVSRRPSFGRRLGNLIPSVTFYFISLDGYATVLDFAKYYLLVLRMQTDSMDILFPFRTARFDACRIALYDAVPGVRVLTDDRERS